MTLVTGPSTPEHAPQGQTIYLNPIPAAVAIVPVYGLNPLSGRKELGLLTIERGIAPQQGKLALPGGYLEQGEDWRAGLLRELHEETGVRIDDPTCVSLKNAHSIDENRKLVIFGAVPVIKEEQLAHFKTNRECTRYEVIFQPRELAFVTHTEVSQRFFAYMWRDYSSALHQLQAPVGFRCSER
jgi:8-oxo-dGTP diphosphatase